MDKEEAFRLYLEERKTLKEVAGLVGVTRTTVWRWLRQAGIPTRSISEARQIAKPATHSEETLERMRARAENARSRITKESRERQRLKMLGRTPPNKGRPMSMAQRLLLTEQRADPEYRRMQSERRSGENHWNWKGGVKDESARRLDRAEWRRRRIEVYERDGWRCADCGERCLNTKDSRANPHRKIQAHHIVPRRHGGSDEMENLVTLCMSCHHKRERRFKDALFG